jgi:hypothetical protein
VDSEGIGKEFAEALLRESRRRRQPATKTIPTIGKIRASLEGVPDAIRDEPLPEDSGEGHDPASIVHVYHPEQNPEKLERLADEPSLRDEVDNPISDHPTVIFETPPELTDADVQNILGSIGADLLRLAQVKGIDAYAWYLTFHQRARQFGIYIPAERLVLFALHAFRRLSLPLDVKLKIGFHALLRHELFHFEVDCMAANWELATGREHYWSGRVDWHRELEEGLANAYMLRGFRHPEGHLRGARGAYQALKRFCESQPAGYRDGPSYARSRASYVSRCRDLSFVIRCFAEDDWEIDPDALDTLLFYPDTFAIDWRRCPIIIEDKLGILKSLDIDLSFFETIAGIVESRSFLRSIGRLGSQMEAIWSRRKSDLARSVNLRGLGFERWKPGGDDCYSVRLDGNYRVHLRRDVDQGCWIAESVGAHRSMGHD